VSAAPPAPSTSATSPPLPPSGVQARRAVGLLLVLLAVMASWLGMQLRQAHHDALAERLAAVGRLRQVQVEDWLNGRLAEARFLSGSPYWASMAQGLASGGGVASAAPLLERAQAFARGTGYDAVLLFDAQARPVTGAAGAGTLPAALPAAVAAALASGEVRFSGPLVDAGGELPALYLVLPLQGTGRPARAAVVLRRPLAGLMSGSMAEWPSPGVAGRTVLWWPLAGVWQGRQAAPTTAQTVVLQSQRSPADRTAVPGADDSPDHAAAWPVAGTDWYLEVALDRQAADQPLRRQGALLALMTTLLALSMLLVMRDRSQRQALAQARSWAESQQARLRLQAELAHQRDHLEDLVAERTRDLQQANQALGDAERFVRAITDQLPGRVVYWDAALRCRYANRAWYAWYGQTPERVLGRRADELDLQGFGTTVQPELLAALSGEPKHFERVTWRDGRRHVHLMHYLPDRDGAEVRGVTALAIDISALKQAEDALVRSRDAAEAASRAKTAFLANMSHEIRTPLNAVIGLAHLLHRDSADPEQRARIDRLAESAGHLLELINDVLDLSRIEAGQLALADTEFALVPLLQQALDAVRDQARAKDLGLLLEADGLPQRVRGDPARLTRALHNLLSNAVKFTDRGDIRLRGALLHQEAGQGLLRFEVADTGIGIALADQPRLFQAFEQVDGSSTRRFGGTGLGLALTRHLARLMGGDTGVDSRPGQGSRFWFTARLGLVPGVAAAGGAEAAPAPHPAPLPAHQPVHQSVHQPVHQPVREVPPPIWPERAAPGLPAPAPLPVPPRRPVDAAVEVGLRLQRQHAGQRVLLVDDHPVNREVARALLERVGLRVVEAADGLDALAAVNHQRPDLVLMDLQMPRLDGLAATRAIRALPGPTLPIVAMTAHADADDRAACLAAGMDDHLAKPVDPRRLYSCMLQWLPTPAAARAGSAPPPAAVPRVADVERPGDPLFSQLAQVRGVDAAGLAERLGGRAGLARRALGLFVAQHGHGLGLPDDGRCDAAQLRQRCHAVAGAAANLGLDALGRQARTLETQAREASATGDPPGPTAVRQLDDDLKALALRLAALLADAPAPAGGGA
jgi:PAS domain S-box-containing protein